MNGWIKLHRKLLKNPIFYKPELLQLFIYCLLTAGHEEKRIIFNGKEEIIPKGSFIAGRKALAKNLKQSESMIYRNLKILADISIISQKSNNRFTLINVVNYSTYQGVESDNEQLANNKRTTSEHKQELKELKELKDIKHMCVSPDLYPPDFEEFWKAYPNSKNKKGAYKTYLACLKGDSRINKATTEQLLRSAKRYAEEVNGKDPQYILHASTFLGPSERWAEYDKPQVNMNGEILRDDVDKNDFKIGGGPDIDYKAYERARRGYDPYTPKRGRETDSPAGVGRTERA